jgi:hypothetical protein
MKKNRTPEQILAHHAQAVRAGDLNAVMDDFSEQSIVITLDKTYQGRNQIRDFYAALIEALPDAEWSAQRVFESDVLLVQWTAKSRRFNVTDGTDTFLFRDGLIHFQTVRATFVAP